jgi:hypothetical protein
MTSTCSLLTHCPVCMMQRAKGGQDNHWVVKLAQGTHSTDVCLTDSAELITRYREAPGGDRVVQKYIEKPVLFKGRKMDLRVGCTSFVIFLVLCCWQVMQIAQCTFQGVAVIPDEYHSSTCQLLLFWASGLPCSAELCRRRRLPVLRVVCACRKSGVFFRCQCHRDRISEALHCGLL